MSRAPNTPRTFPCAMWTASSAASRTLRARSSWSSSLQRNAPMSAPTTLQELVEVKQQLGADGDRLQGVFVTLDPERDTPEVLKAYLGNFDPGFVGLHGTPDETAAVAKDFKLFYKKVPGKTEGALHAGPFGRQLCL